MSERARKPVRFTDELPDDEGRVYVTDVPGSPFQILGRRSNSGELFVGSLLFPEPSGLSVVDAAIPGVEIVTGAEPEDLIFRTREHLLQQFGSAELEQALATGKLPPPPPQPSPAPALADILPEEEPGATANKPPLAALLRRASRMAERMFADQGEVTMFWLCDVPKRAGPVLLVTPVVVPNAGSVTAVKDAIAASVAEFCRTHAATRYVQAAEAWTLTAETVRAEGEAAFGRGKSLSEHPKRQEIIFFCAEDEREALFARREIIRPQSGKAYLGKLSKIQPSDGFTGILPPTGTMQ